MQVAVRTAVSAIPIRTAGAAMIIKSLGVRRGHSVCVAVAQCASRSLSVRRVHSVCFGIARSLAGAVRPSLRQQHDEEAVIPAQELASKPPPLTQPSLRQPVALG